MLFALFGLACCTASYLAQIARASCNKVEYVLGKLLQLPQNSKKI